MPSRYLKTVNGSYQYQRKVPTEIVDLMGTRFVRRYGLGCDRRGAELKRDALALEHSTLFAQLRELPKADREAIVAAGGVQKAGQLIKNLELSIGLLNRAADKLAKPSEDDDQSDEMVGAAVRIAAEARRSAKSDQVRVDALLAVPAVVGERNAKGTLLWWLERWNMTKGKPLSPSHISGVNLAIRRLVDTIGNKQVTSVTKPDMKAFAEKLVRLVSPSTADHSFSLASAVFNWLMGEDALVNNPAFKVKVPVPALKFHERADKGRKAFSGEQARQIIAHFDGIAADYPEERWILRLAFYQGLRAEEIIQLKTDDVRMIDGIAALEITDRHGHLKNAASLGPLPFHPTIRDEFLAYVATLKPGLVFPETAGNGYRKASNFCKRFGRVLRKEIGITDRRLTLHSTKHTFGTVVHRAHLPTQVEFDLCRHAMGRGAHSTYVHGQRMSILMEGLAKVDPLSL